MIYDLDGWRVFGLDEVLEALWVEDQGKLGGFTETECVPMFRKIGNRVLIMEVLASR